jgi:hypothetical protein
VATAAAKSPELQERELLKRARLASAMAEALRARWAAPENRQPFTEIAHAAVRDLQACATTLGADAVAEFRV